MVSLIPSNKYVIAHETVNHRNDVVFITTTYHFRSYFSLTVVLI